jgi:hypothetical protein
VDETFFPKQKKIIRVMVGQWSNFFKNFGNYIMNLPEVETIKMLAGPVSVGYNVYNNLNKIDNPNNSQQDIIVDIAKAAAAPLDLIPGVGSTLNKAANAVIDSADYVTDFIEGRKDAPPVPADINSRNNQIGSIPNKILNSAPFRQFFSNFF